MVSVFFAACATAAAGVMAGDCYVFPFEQPTAPPASRSAASPAPVGARTEIFMGPPKEQMNDEQTSREPIPVGALGRMFLRGRRRLVRRGVGQAHRSPVPRQATFARQGAASWGSPPLMGVPPLERSRAWG